MLLMPTKCSVYKQEKSVVFFFSSDHSPVIMHGNKFSLVAYLSYGKTVAMQASEWIWTDQHARGGPQSFI